MSNRWSGRWRGPRSRSLVVGSLVIATLGLGWSAIAIARTSWLASDSGEQSTTPRPEDLQAELRDQGPTMRPNGDVSSSLVGVVSQIPELNALMTELVVDQIEGDSRVGIVSLVSTDGGRVEIVLQQLPGPVPIEVFGSPDTTRWEVGPNGEDIVIRDTGALQVVVINREGRMANVIVEPINRLDPAATSALAGISISQMTEWAFQLLENADA